MLEFRQTLEDGTKDTIEIACSHIATYFPVKGGTCVVFKTPIGLYKGVKGAVPTNGVNLWYKIMVDNSTSEVKAMFKALNMDLVKTLYVE